MRCAPPREETPGSPLLLGRLIAAGVLLAACESSGTGPESESVPSGIRFSSAELTLFVPTTATLGATVVDQRGAVMTGRSLTFETRDPTVARVNAAGVVTSVSAGESWIVARSGTLVDSVRVTVRYDVLMEEARVRMRGAIDGERGWNPFSVAHSRLGPTGGTRLYLQMMNQARLDTGLVIVLPSMPVPGVYPLDVVSPPEIFQARSLFHFDRPFGVALIETVADVYMYIARSGSRLEIESVDDAGRYGLTGTHRGRVVLRAEGHRLDLATQWTENPIWIPTGDTLTVHGDFAVSYESQAIGQASYVFLGGPNPMVADGREALWSPWTSGHGSLHIEGPPFITLVRATPSPGVTQIDSVGMYYWQENGKQYVTATWPDDPAYCAASTGGQLTITGVRQPEGAAWGELIGSLTARLDYWREHCAGTDPNPIDSGTLGLAFHVPILPEDRWTAGATTLGGTGPPFLERLRAKLGPAR